MAAMATSLGFDSSALRSDDDVLRKMNWPSGPDPPRKRSGRIARLGFEPSVFRCVFSWKSIPQWCGGSLLRRSCPLRAWRSTRPTSARTSAHARWGFHRSRPSVPNIANGPSRGRVSVSETSGVGVPPGTRISSLSARSFVFFVSGSATCGLGPPGGCNPLVFRGCEVRFLRSPPLRGLKRVRSMAGPPPASGPLPMTRIAS
jgi:hypothetical protein